MLYGWRPPEIVGTGYVMATGAAATVIVTGLGGTTLSGFGCARATNSSIRLVSASKSAGSIGGISNNDPSLGDSAFQLFQHQLNRAACTDFVAGETYRLHTTEAGCSRFLFPCAVVAIDEVDGTCSERLNEDDGSTVAAGGCVSFPQRGIRVEYLCVAVRISQRRLLTGVDPLERGPHGTEGHW